MSPEARQRDIRSRTFDANESTTSVNPVAIEMADIYPSESMATGEIKVDDDVEGGGASFMRSPPPTTAAMPSRNRLESVNAKENGLRFKNPLKRNKKAGL